ncbi:DUF4397 domain-containing protein [Pontibacter liquoris]|uniref:DUF4397 domain-containing protein n=1 Tax=Pontibacter liquoris TaxID=2905677 RepID=UPI001FA7F73F|nr:DUF4397 domain-containing protein [Pontibacter liquoris]
MKNIVTKSFAILVAGLVLGACEKNTIAEHYEPMHSGALVKVVHAAEMAPMVNFFLNSQKVTGLTPAATGQELGLSYAGTAVFPATYGYANVAAGNYTVQVIDTTSEKGVAEKVASAPVTLEEGASYSAFLIGNTGAFETLLLKDALPAKSETTAYIRFVHVMADAPVNFDVKAVRKATTTEPEIITNIGANVAYKGNTAYVEIAPGTYDFPIYAAGATVPYTTLTGVAPVAGRVYTLYVRGNYTATPAATNRVLIRER